MNTTDTSNPTEQVPADTTSQVLRGGLLLKAVAAEEEKPKFVDEWDEPCDEHHPGATAYTGWSWQTAESHPMHPTNPWSRRNQE